jgi:hypothetical protein
MNLNLVVVNFQYTQYSPLSYTLLSVACCFFDPKFLSFFSVINDTVRAALANRVGLLLHSIAGRTNETTVDTFSYALEGECRSCRAIRASEQVKIKESELDLDN